MVEPRKRLKVLRAERDLTQYRAADLLGIGLNRYWRIEHGYATPSEDERQVIAAFFGIPETELFPEAAA